MGETCGTSMRVGGGDRVCTRPAGHPPPHGDGSGAEWSDEAPAGEQPDTPFLTPETTRLDEPDR